MASRSTTVHRGPRAVREPGGAWSHVLVSICACVLTVSILGSIVFLVWRVYDRRQLKEKVEAFVASLENRTPAELAEKAQDLKAAPKVAKYVLPAIMKTIRGAKSEHRQRSAIEISRAFLNNTDIVNTLLALPKDPRETVAAAAVRALASADPPTRAAELVGQCLADAQTAAATDEACAALYALGEPGRQEMGRRIEKLSTGRRIWLVAYVEDHASPMQRPWLEALGRDPEPAVRSAAAQAMARLSQPKVEQVEPKVEGSAGLESAGAEG